MPLHEKVHKIMSFSASIQPYFEKVGISQLRNNALTNDVDTKPSDALDSSKSSSVGIINSGHHLNRC